MIRGVLNMYDTKVTGNNVTGDNVTAIEQARYRAILKAKELSNTKVRDSKHAEELHKQLGSIMKTYNIKWDELK
jgi:hypothetical protein